MNLTQQVRVVSMEEISELSIAPAPPIGATHHRLAAPLRSAILRTRQWLLGRQHASGYWDGELEGDCVDVATAVKGFEDNFPLRTAVRLIDPNMGRSPASTKRDVTWQDEFADAGLNCDLADDSGVGRQRLNQYLKPDEATGRPRLHVHSRCVVTNSQMKRFAWDEFRFAANRDTKQVPKDKYSDYPTLLKYLMNFEPTFHFLKHGAPTLGRPGKRRGAY